MIKVERWIPIAVTLDVVHGTLPQGIKATVEPHDETWAKLTLTTGSERTHEVQKWSADFGYPGDGPGVTDPPPRQRPTDEAIDQVTDRISTVAKANVTLNRILKILARRGLIFELDIDGL